MGRQVRPMFSIPDDPTALLGDRVVPGPPGQADVLNPRRPDVLLGDRVVPGPPGQADVLNPRRPGRLTRGSSVPWPPGLANFVITAVASRADQQPGDIARFTI